MSSFLSRNLFVKAFFYVLFFSSMVWVRATINSFCFPSVIIFYVTLSKCYKSCSCSESEHSGFIFYNSSSTASSMSSKYLTFILKLNLVLVFYGLGLLFSSIWSWLHEWLFSIDSSSAKSQDDSISEKLSSLFLCSWSFIFLSTNVYYRFLQYSIALSFICQAFFSLMVAI